jgi:hypothetical protein
VGSSPRLLLALARFLRDRREERRWETSRGAADSGESSQPSAHRTSERRCGQYSELRCSKPERGRVRRGPGAEWEKSLERREAQESNVLLRALNKHGGVTDLQSAVSLEAGPKISRG